MFIFEACSCTNTSSTGVCGGSVYPVLCIQAQVCMCAHMLMTVMFLLHNELNELFFFVP